MEYTFFLTAGVIAAFVTGVFSLIISINNNGKIAKLERQRQEFILKQGKIESLQKLYEEVSSLDSANNMFMNLRAHAGKSTFLKKCKDVTEKADRNAKILYDKFYKVKYLLDEDISEKIANSFEEIDDCSRTIIDLMDDREGNADELRNLTLERVSQICILEENDLPVLHLETYYN
jgi:hypothetical protein